MPSVTLVGVVNADVGLHLGLPLRRAHVPVSDAGGGSAPDAASGPAASSSRPTRPDHYAIDASRYDFEGFVAAELSRAGTPATRRTPPRAPDVSI